MEEWEKELQYDPERSARALQRYGLEPDPVIEAYKKDVDQTLIVTGLRRTVEERCQTLLAMSRLVDEMRAARLRAQK